MKWEVEINGRVLPETFDSEDAANQHAANIRGGDREMKIDVRPQGSAKTESKPSATPEPVRGVLEALEQQSKTKK
jgi:hypothetical protein